MAKWEFPKRIAFAADYVAAKHCELRNDGAGASPEISFPLQPRLNTAQAGCMFPVGLNLTLDKITGAHLRTVLHARCVQLDRVCAIS